MARPYGTTRQGDIKMPIINSTYTVDQIPQADSRRWVKETHTDHTGKTYSAEYLASEGFDYGTCLTARAENIGAEIDRKEAALNEAQNFVIPITKLTFLKRLTVQERISCKALAKTDPVVEDFFAMLDMAQDVVLGNSDLIMGLSYLESVGGLASGRALEIGSPD